MAAAIRLSQQHSCSFDHLVGAGEQRRRHIKAKHFRRLEVDHKLVLGRSLHIRLSGEKYRSHQDHMKIKPPPMMNCRNPYAAGNPCRATDRPSRYLLSNTASNQSNALRLSEERFIISQWLPAPSSELNRTSSLGQRSASKKVCALAASGSSSACVISVGQRMSAARRSIVNNSMQRR